MTDIVVTKLDTDTLVVDSRIVAAQLGIEHRAFLQTIKNHQHTIESNFENVTFEMDTSTPNKNGARIFEYKGSG